MALLPQVVHAEYRGGHSIHLVFQRFFLEGGTVAWPNGADIASETLHESAAEGAAA